MAGQRWLGPPALLPWRLALWASAALGARLRSVVVDRVQRDGAASLAGAVPEHQLTLDFDACQQPFGGADRVRLLLNLSSGRRVPVWASCLGVTYEADAEVTEYLPLHLQLHEHGTCEGELENDLLRDDFDPEFEPVYGNTRQARAGFLAQALFAHDRGVWPADLLDNGTAGARRRLQEEAVPRPAGRPMNVSLPVCGGCVPPPAGATHYTMLQLTAARLAYAMVSGGSQGDVSQSEQKQAVLFELWSHEYNHSYSCLAPLLCSQDDSGFVPPAQYQAKALATHHAQARLRTATYFATRVQAAGASSSRLTRRIRNVNNSPYWYGGLGAGALVLSAPVAGLAYGIMQIVLAVSKRRDKRKVDLGADNDETADLWAEYMEDDLTRQLLAWSPLDGRQACASAQAQHWADTLASQTPPPPNVTRLDRVTFGGDRSAPEDQPSPGPLADVKTAAAMHRWLQDVGLAPRLRDYPQNDQGKVDRVTAKHQASRAERGYPTQWQWDPPCRALGGGTYNASAESAACRGPDSTAPGPTSMYPRSFASDNRCKFVPLNLSKPAAWDEQRTYECVPAQIDSQGWVEAWRSEPCVSLDEKQLYCGLAAGGDAARAVAAKCAGSADRDAALRRALVDSLWVLLDDDGGGWIEAEAGENELATFQRYFCSAGQKLVNAQFWFRSAGDPSAVGVLAGRECPCAESSHEGLKVCPLNPWDRLDPRNGSKWGWLRTHGQLQGCVRNRGLSYCVPLLDYASLRAAIRQEPAVTDDRCNSSFFTNSLGDDPAVLAQSSAMQYAIRQLQTLEALTDESGLPQLDCTEARSVCALRDAQGQAFWPNSTDRSAWDHAVTSCYRQSEAGETKLEFVDKATCAVRGQPGTTVPLPSFNRALITKQVYKVGTGGTANARQYEHVCKPSLVEVDGAESLRLTVARSALDVAANADALELFLTDLLDTRRNGTGLGKIAERQRQLAEEQLQNLNLTTSVEGWLGEVMSASLGNLGTRLSNLETDARDIKQNFNSLTQGLEARFGALDDSLRGAQQLVDGLDEDRHRLVAEIRALGAAVAEAQGTTKGLMAQFASVLGKSSSTAAEVSGLAQRLLYGRERYRQHVGHVHEELALSLPRGLFPFLPTTPYGAAPGEAREYGVAPRELAGPDATAPVHESRLWQAVRHADGSLWLYQLRLLTLCDLRWVLYGLRDTGFDGDVMTKYWGPPRCRLGSLADSLRCTGCRLRATARRCPARAPWLVPEQAEAAWLANVTWLRSGAAHEPLGGAGECAGPAEPVPKPSAFGSAAADSAWFGARPLAPVVDATRFTWARQLADGAAAVADVPEDTEAGVPGLDLGSSADVRGLLAAACLGPQELWGLDGATAGPRPLLASTAPSGERLAHGFWSRESALASGRQVAAAGQQLQAIREQLVCDTSTQSARAFRALTLQLAAAEQVLPPGVLTRDGLPPPASLPEDELEWHLSPWALAGLLQQQWALAVRAAANSPLLAEFQYATEGLLPPLGLWTDFTQRVPPPVETTLADSAATLWSAPPTAPPAELNASDAWRLQGSNARARTAAELEAAAAAPSAEPQALGQEDLRLLRQYDTVRDLTNCYTSSWLSHTNRAIRLHRVRGTREPRVELALALDRADPSLARLNSSELDALEEELRALAAFEVVQVDAAGSELLARDWYWAGEFDCAQHGGCFAGTGAGSSGRYVFDLAPTDVCLGSSSFQRASRGAGGTCLNTVRLGVRPGADGNDTSAQAEAAGDLSDTALGGGLGRAERPQDLHDGTYTMFTYEEFHRQEHGSLLHERPSARDFDPRKALVSPSDLVRAVYGVSVPSLGRERAFCANAPAQPAGHVCRVLAAWELLAYNTSAGALADTTRLRWRSAAGGGRVTAILRVPEAGSGWLGGGATPGANATNVTGGPLAGRGQCPADVRVLLPGTRNLALEYDQGQLGGPAAGWLLRLEPWPGGSSCAQGTYALPRGAAPTQVWRPPAGPGPCDPRVLEVLDGAEGATCFRWSSSAPAADTQQTASTIVDSVYNDEHGVLLAQLSNLTASALAEHDEWQRLVQRAVHDYAPWVTRVNGVWLPGNRSAGAGPQNNSWLYHPTPPSGNPAAPANNQGGGAGAGYDDVANTLLALADQLAKPPPGRAGNVTTLADLENLRARLAALQALYDQNAREVEQLLNQTDPVWTGWQNRTQHGSHELWRELVERAHTERQLGCLANLTLGGGLTAEQVSETEVVLHDYQLEYKARQNGSARQPVVRPPEEPWRPGTTAAFWTTSCLCVLLACVLPAALGGRRGLVRCPQPRRRGRHHRSGDDDDDDK